MYLQELFREKERERRVSVLKIKRSNFSCFWACDIIIIIIFVKVIINNFVIIFNNLIPPVLFFFLFFF